MAEYASGVDGGTATKAGDYSGRRGAAQVEIDERAKIGVGCD